MKRVNVFLLRSLLFVSFLNIKSQGLTCSTSITPPSSAAASGNCNDCNSLDDYVPLSSDSILYVRLNFHYLMVNSTNPGFYQNATINEALATVNFLNSLCFDSLHKPALRMSPAPAYIKRPKIKFVLNSFAKYYDSNAYFSSGIGNWAPLAAYETDPNAIDVIFKGDGSGAQYGEAHGIPAKAVKLSNGTGGLNPPNGGYVWWAGTELFAHELGHALGLAHTYPSYYGCVNDFYLEDYALWWAGGGACDPSIDSTHSNNLMNNAFTCRYYMSPRQLAQCHYNLRNTFYLIPSLPQAKQEPETCSLAQMFRLQRVNPGT